MSQNTFFEENNSTSSIQNGDESRNKLIFLATIVGCILVGVSVGLLVIHSLLPQSTQEKNIKSATAAARKQIPDAKVSSLKVAGGFAMAVVSDTSSDGQAGAGNTTIFRVNKDGSMTQIANGSSFSPIDLLEYGIPLKAQGQLTGSPLGTIKQNLASSCGYTSGNAPGYNGFDGSFNPSGWQIDSATLGDLEQALTTTISNKNTAVDSEQKIICVNATRNNSNVTTDTQNYISTFTLDIQFITIDGTYTTHTFTFAIGSHYYHSYTLDGKSLT